MTERGSRENLIGVSIFVPELQIGTVSNDYGFFSLTLPEGLHDVIFSYIGYAAQRKSVELNED